MERRFSLWVEHLHSAGEAVIAPPALPYTLDEVAIVERAEEGKRFVLTIFLTHEQERQIGRQKHQTGRKALFGRIDQSGQSIPVRTVTDMIVVLHADDEAITRRALIRRAPVPAAIGAVNTAVEVEGLSQRPNKTADVAE